MEKSLDGAPSSVTNPASSVPLYPIETRALVSGYVEYRLLKQGPGLCDNPVTNSGDQNDSDSPSVLEAVRRLAEEVEQQHKNMFSEICTPLRFNEDDAMFIVATTVNHIFDGDVVNWGRLMALFAFGGAFAEHCVERNVPFLVDQVVDWIAEYIDNHLMSWIQQHHGWNGLLEFYDGSRRGAAGESRLLPLSTMCSCVIAAMGILTLGAAVYSKK